MAVKALIALLPVLVMLAALYWLDSHRLVAGRLMAWVLFAGALAALVSYAAGYWGVEVAGLGASDYALYVAPALEEVMKALLMVVLFRTNRVGFTVDAAILGFAVGAGFSVVENALYLLDVSQANHGTWIVRGFGTAIMHGGSTAIFSLAAQRATERHMHMNPAYYLPGLVVAILLHSMFNHFPVSAISATVVNLLILSILFLLLFERGAVEIHNFLEVDFTAHKRLLKQIEGGDLSGCEAGRFIGDLQQTLSGPAVEDMIEYLRLHTELILEMERILLARENDTHVEIDERTRHKLLQMHKLENRIGKAAMHTLQPHLHFSRQELWEIHILDEETGVKAF